MSERNEKGQFAPDHQMTQTREYKSWNAMKNRCLNTKCRNYKDYGGRGITICEQWVNSFEQFYEDMGNRPINTSIDRIDVNGNYEPNNCHWATPKEQARNRRNTIWVEYKEEEITLAELAEIFNIDYDNLYNRIYNHDWNIEKAIKEEIYKGEMITYAGKTQNMKDWARELRVPYKALHLRFTRYRKNKPEYWTIERCLTEPFLENKRRDWSQIFTYNGKSQTMKEWIDEYGISKYDFGQRIRDGWSIEEALTTPPQQKKIIYTHNGKSLTLPEWAKELGISAKTLYTRKYKNLPIEKILAK